MSHFERASAALQAGDHQMALNEIGRHLADASNPDAAASWVVGECMAGLRQSGQALDFIAAALDDVAFQTPERFLRAGGIALDAGRHDLALLYGLKAKRLAVEDPDINLFLLQAAQTTGNLDLLPHVIPPLLKTARPDDLNRIITLIGPDRSNPLALDLFRRLAELYPERSEYLVVAYVLAREFCDYDYIEAIRRAFPMETWRQRPDLVGAETPLDNLYWCGDGRINRLAVNYPSGALAPIAPERKSLPSKPVGEKLHIGYLSSDFQPGHATMLLMGDVLRQHDRTRVDVTLFCHTAPEHLAGQQRPHHWGRIVSINGLDDAAAAETIRAREVDILIDLKGHTAHSRSNILNHGAAPLQVAWLGFPGSVTGIDLDYVISDRFVTPDDASADFHEKLCRLPHSYQPNDPTRPDPPATSRRELGLPEDAYVMACFNTPRKISLEVIELWAQILQKAPNAVLWLLHAGERLSSNIRTRLQRHGIEPRRVFFAPGLPQQQHLARLKAADIAIDTFPYNGHTTTSDALWAGLPVVAVKGTNFASRVSESLLNAVGLPELIAPDQSAYVALAVSLAADSEKTSALRRKLAANRLTTPLYDSRRFAESLERAYRMMHERAAKGLPPAAFDVPA